MNPKIERLKQIASELHEMFPAMTSAELSFSKYGDDPPSVELVLRGHKTYAEATDEMRNLGIGVREKTPMTGELTYTRLVGDSDGVKVITYPDELPPTCHIETFVEKIPKLNTVDTGEFIEVERRKLVCG